MPGSPVGVYGGTPYGGGFPVPSSGPSGGSGGGAVLVGGDAGNDTMPIQPGAAYTAEFTTADPTTGEARNADVLPLATAHFYGAGTGTMALTVTNLATGLYKAAGTVPAGRVSGDVLAVSVAATVAAVAGNAVVGSAVVDAKDGYALGATGLDLITVTAPTGVANTFPKMLVLLYRRFFGKSTMTATQLKTFADDGVTVVTTQAVSDDGTTQVQQAAS